MSKRQKMKEWQKLLFNAIFNIAAALIVGGFLKLMLDFKSIIASVEVVIMGIYLMLFITFLAMKIEREQNGR